MTEDDVWKQAYERKDYPGGNSAGNNKPGDVYGDYVFGRMMKTGFKWDADSVEFFNDNPRRDYQGWAGKYPTYTALLEAAAASLK